VFAATHPAHYRVMKYPVLNEMHPDLRERAHAATSLLKKIILAGQQEHRIRDCDPDELVLLCRSVVSGLAQHFVETADTGQSLKDIERIAEAVVTHCGIGLGTNAERKRHEARVRRTAAKR
jgi:hypothetical protein